MLTGPFPGLPVWTVRWIVWLKWFCMLVYLVDVYIFLSWFNQSCSKVVTMFHIHNKNEATKRNMIRKKETRGNQPWGSCSGNTSLCSASHTAACVICLSAIMRRPLQLLVSEPCGVNWWHRFETDLHTETHGTLLDGMLTLNIPICQTRHWFVWWGLPPQICVKLVLTQFRN